MRKTRSSQITSCFDCPPWVRPPGTVTWFASNRRATSAAQKATRIPRRSKTTTTWGSPAGVIQRLTDGFPSRCFYVCAVGQSTQRAPGNRDPQRLCERWSDCLLLWSQVTHSLLNAPPSRSAAGVYSNMCEVMILQLTLSSWQQSGGGRPRRIRHMLFISVRWHHHFTAHRGRSNCISSIFPPPPPACLQHGHEALSALRGHLPAQLRSEQVRGARGEPLENLPHVQRAVSAGLWPEGVREPRAHPLRRPPAHLWLEKGAPASRDRGNQCFRTLLCM